MKIDQVDDLFTVTKLKMKHYVINKDSFKDIMYYMSL